MTSTVTSPQPLATPAVPTYTRLFEPGRIGNLTIPNRIVKSPQTTGFGNPDGTVGHRTLAHYEGLARGGVGLVLVEYTYIDDDASKSVHCQLGISSPDHISGLGQLVDVVHAHGAKVGLQIEHCGRQKFLGTPPIKAPSAVPWPLLWETTGLAPQPLTLDEVKGIVEAFGDAALRAYNAGFDLVELHGAHGYLITNFLSPHTNRRDDLYGGSFENRTRFLIEVIRNVKSKVPSDFPITIRLSDTDNEPGGITIKEFLATAQICEAEGLDAIHVSGGDHHTMHMQVAPQLMDLALHADAARQARELLSIPVIVSGSIMTPVEGERLIADGAGDFISMGRPLLADPNWALKARSGRADEIRPCIRCNEGCLTRGLFPQRAVGCSVNPVLGHEGRFEIQLASTRRRVAVVGAGPAGLEAAAVAGARGHEVTLFATGPLGGGLLAASTPDFLHDLRRLLDQQLRMIEVHGVAVVQKAPDIDTLNTFDAVVFATGGVSNPVALDGWNGEVRDAEELLREEGRISGSVAVLGNGLWGARVALHFARAGAEVTIVGTGDDLLGDAPPTELMTYPSALQEAGVRVLRGESVTTAEGFFVSAPDALPLADDALVVNATGQRGPSPSELSPGLEEAGVDVFVVGDAAGPGTLHDAIHTAFFSARLI